MKTYITYIRRNRFTKLMGFEENIILRKNYENYFFKKKLILCTLVKSIQLNCEVADEINQTNLNIIIMYHYMKKKKQKL